MIRKQVLGEAVECTSLESLSRYEVHLDRKLERMLTVLLRLQNCGDRRSRIDRGNPLFLLAVFNKGSFARNHRRCH